MSEEPENPEIPENDNSGSLQQVDIDSQMRTAYLDYAMSEIGRASCRERVSVVV